MGTKILAAEGPNGEDVVQHTDAKGNVIREEIIICDDEGNEIRRRPRSIPPPPATETSGPASGVVEKSPKEKAVLPTESMTAMQMAELAIRTRESTVGKKASELLANILGECVKHVLDGEHEYVVNEEVSGEIITQVIKELKSRGYKVSRRPEPGQGTYIEVKWPTKMKKSSKSAGKKRGRKKKLDGPTPERSPTPRQGSPTPRQGSLTPSSLPTPLSKPSKT